MGCLPPGHMAGYCQPGAALTDKHCVVEPSWKRELPNVAAIWNHLGSVGNSCHLRPAESE